MMKAHVSKDTTIVLPMDLEISKERSALLLYPELKIKGVNKGNKKQDGGVLSLDQK